MLKLTANKKTIKKSPRNRQLLEMLISLEKCNFTINLTTRRPREVRSPLFDHEAPISMLFTIGSLYEALLSFDEIKGDIASELSNNPNDDVQNMLDFINSKDVQDFKNVLRITRNRSSFHVDKRIINQYFTDSREDESEDETVLLWVREDGKPEHSPISSDILSWYFINMFNKKDVLFNTVFLADIYNKLQYIASYLMVHWYEAVAERS